MIMISDRRVRGLSAGLWLVWLCVSFVSAGEAPYKIALFTSSHEGAKSEKIEAVKYFCERRLGEFNADGGINGVPVELIYFDDRFDVAKLKTAVDEALSEEQLIAILGIGSSTRGAEVITWWKRSRRKFCAISLLISER